MPHNPLTRSSDQPAVSAATRSPLKPVVLARPHFDDENYGDFVQRCKAQATPVYLFDALFKIVGEYMKGSSKENAQRNERLDSLERRYSELESARAIDQERIKALEARGALLYKGVWARGTTYVAGDACTWDGSVWIAAAATRAQPGHDRTWRLAVKKGRDGRDGQDVRS